MSTTSPDASFDVLYVLGQLAEQDQYLTTGEIQIFIYLACLLGLYDGKPVSEWGYDFLATPASSPFSLELLDAVDSLAKSGLVVEKNGALSLSESGQQELRLWNRLSRFSSREPYLRGATGAALAMPLTSVTEGVELEPQLSNARALESSRHLLDDAGIVRIYRQFSILESALGRTVPDFMVPAVVWLSYLLDQASKDAA